MLYKEAIHFRDELVRGLLEGVAPDFLPAAYDREFRFVHRSNNHSSVMVGITNEGVDYRVFVASNDTPRSNKLAEMLGGFFGGEVIVQRLRSFGLGRPPSYRPGPQHHRSLLNAHRPLVLGSEISVQGGYGTLGGFVRNSHSGQVELLSCQHVLADCRGHIGGFDVHQPSRAVAASPIASTLSSTAFVRPGNNAADIAFASLLNGNHGIGNVIPRGMGFALEGSSLILPPDDLKLSVDLPVFKIGKATGITEGRIVARRLSIDSYLKYRERWRTKRSRYTFMPTILIDSVNDEPFSRLGDSGGLIFCKSPNANQLYALGLVSGSMPPTVWENGGRNLTRYTWACDLATALRATNRTWL